MPAFDAVADLEAQIVRAERLRTRQLLFIERLKRIGSDTTKAERFVAGIDELIAKLNDLRISGLRKRNKE
jgi:hypothetical protein